MEKTVQEFRIIGVNGKIIGAAPQPEKLTWITRLLMSMRKNYQYKTLADVLVIPVLPIWGKDNNTQQWRNINDDEILPAAF